MNGNNPRQRRQTLKSEADGFLYNALEEYQQELVRLAAYTFKEETKKFLKQEGRKLSALQKKTARKLVGTSKGKKKNWDAKKSYMKKFKTSKVFEKGNESLVSAYNSANHAHLIEYGHKMLKHDGTPTKREPVEGRYVIIRSVKEFASSWSKDCDDFIVQVFWDN